MKRCKFKHLWEVEVNGAAAEIEWWLASGYFYQSLSKYDLFLFVVRLASVANWLLNERSLSIIFMRSRVNLLSKHALSSFLRGAFPKMR